VFGRPIGQLAQGINALDGVAAGIERRLWRGDEWELAGRSAKAGGSRVE
jgi:hypothetical protein